ncbi:hypothetical protein ACSBR2_023643 [Camellia fascicularis]
MQSKFLHSIHTKKGQSSARINKTKLYPRVAEKVYKVDRHGKRPIPSDESEKKEEEEEEEGEEEEHIFPIFPARSQHDMTAMVSALTQVIANSDQNPVLLHSNPLVLSQSGIPELNQSQPDQDQGITC